jgi:hypothetical protein
MSKDDNPGERVPGPGSVAVRCGGNLGVEKAALKEGVHFGGGLFLGASPDICKPVAASTRRVSGPGAPLAGLWASQQCASPPDLQKSSSVSVVP